jgi:RNA polymerase sigma factor (sigma-70 family)
MAQVQLTNLYAAHGRDVLAYALRRAPSAEDAADAVADTFLVAWRRLRDVPPEPEARLWLYRIAQRALASQRRGADRRGRLAERLHVEARAVVGSAPADEQRDTVLCALATLGADDRELLMLIGWEGLTPRQAARELDISAVAPRARLFRARRRLGAALEDHSCAAGMTTIDRALAAANPVPDGSLSTPGMESAGYSLLAGIIEEPGGASRPNESDAPGPGKTGSAVRSGPRGGAPAPRV